MVRHQMCILKLAVLLFFTLGMASVVVAADRTPQVEISLDRPVINAGESVRVSWDSKFVKYCQISHGVGLVKRKGDVNLSPAKTTTYTMTCYSTKWKASLSEAEKKDNEIQVTFEVRVEGVQPLVSFSANTMSIYEGDPITLSWSADHVDSVNINQGIGKVDLKGSLTLTPARTTEYVLTAKGPGGVVVQKVEVTVNSRAQ